MSASATQGGHNNMTTSVTTHSMPEPKAESAAETWSDFSPSLHLWTVSASLPSTQQHYVHSTRFDVKLECVSEEKDLGVIISEDLKCEKKV